MAAVRESPAEPSRRRCSPSWARLIAKVFQADLILDHLDLGPPEKPPHDIREIVRVPVEDEEREIAAHSA